MAVVTPAAGVATLQEEEDNDIPEISVRLIAADELTTPAQVASLPVYAATAEGIPDPTPLAEDGNYAGQQEVTGGALAYATLIPDSDISDEPSAEHLIALMKDSRDDLTIVESRINLPHWKPVFENITASNYGRMMQYVDIKVNQVHVGSMVAAMVKDFTCEYVVRALEHVTLEPAAFVELVIPYCQDLQAKYEQIQAKLSPWHVAVTWPAFEEALACPDGGNRVETSTLSRHTSC